MSKNERFMPGNTTANSEPSEEVEDLVGVSSKGNSDFQLANLQDVAKLDLLSFIWDEDIAAALDKEVLTRSIDSHNSSHNISLSTANDTAEISVDKARRLISVKRTSYNLLQDNHSYFQSLQRALAVNRDAEKEIESIEAYFAQAEAFAEEEKGVALMSTHTEKVRLPLYPSIYKRIPLLAAQSGEMELIRLLSSSYSWSKDESVRLKKAVLRQNIRNATLHLADSDQCPENLLEEISKWTEKEILSGKPAEIDEKENYDWICIAEEVGGTHTSEDCRTRWTMVERPGIEQGLWSVDEKGQLRNIIQNHSSHEETNIIRDWKTVAEELDTGRLPIDCFSMCQQESMMETQSHMVSGQEMTSTSGTNPVLASKKNIKWSPNADEAIISHVARESGFRRPRLFYQLDKVDNIDFSKLFRGRPVNANAEEVRARWQIIKERWKENPLVFNSKKPKE